MIEEYASAIAEIHARSDDVAERSVQLVANIAALVSMSEDWQGAVAAFKIEQHNN